MIRAKIIKICNPREAVDRQAASVLSKTQWFSIIWLDDAPGCDIRVSGFSLTVEPFLG